jgi:hypothetical protein
MIKNIELINIATSDVNDNNLIKINNGINMIIVKKNTRPLKKALYEEERLFVLNKLNNILGINDINNSFLLYELENNIEKQKQILELEKDVKKFFACSTWSFFNAKTKRSYMSLLRSIYRNMNYDIAYKTIKIKVDDKWIPTQNYYICKKIKNI